MTADRRNQILADLHHAMDRRVRRRRAATAGVGLGVLAGLILAASAWWLMVPHPAAPAPAPGPVAKTDTPVPRPDVAPRAADIRTQYVQGRTGMIEELGTPPDVLIRLASGPAGPRTDLIDDDELDRLLAAAGLPTGSARIAGRVYAAAQLVPGGPS